MWGLLGGVSKVCEHNSTFRQIVVTVGESGHCRKELDTVKKKWSGIFGHNTKAAYTQYLETAKDRFLNHWREPFQLANWPSIPLKMSGAFSTEMCFAIYPSRGS